MKTLVISSLDDSSSSLNKIYLGFWTATNRDDLTLADWNNLPQAPSPFQTPEDILRASQFVSASYDHLMESLVNWLNTVQKVPRSKRYWEALAGLWLMCYLDPLYDHYLRLKTLDESLDEKVSVKVFGCEDLSIGRPEDFYHLRTTPAFHLLFYSDILKNLSWKNLCLDKGHSAVSIPTPKKRSSRSTRDYAKTVLMRGRRINLQHTDFGLQSARRILGMSVGAFGQDIDKDISSLEIEDFRHNSKNEFEELAAKLVFKYLPKEFLSSFHAENLDEVFVGCHLYNFDLSLRAALTVEQGYNWVNYQHGGVYGQALSFPFGKVEYSVPDYFATWGWNYDHLYPGKKVALPSPYLSRLKNSVKRNPSRDILFLPTLHPPFGYRFHSCLGGDSVVDYLQDRKTFLDGLNPTALKSILYKPYPKTYGINESQYVARISKDRFSGSTPLNELLRSCRALVTDYLGTSFVEGLTLNIPTIGFWTRQTFAMTSEADSDFTELERVGIFHRTPESAAKFLNLQFENLENWFGSQEVQSAKNKFLSQHGRTSPTWEKDWRQFLLNL